MSYCREEGKDQIIFVTKEDHQQPSTAALKEEDDDDEPGLILENGEINWNCPCLGGMAAGPCGYDFREAFSCFHYSTAEPKGSDCFEQFRGMQECMSKFPELYGEDQDNGDNENVDIDELEKMSTAGENKDNSANNQKDEVEKDSALEKGSA